MTAPVTQPTIYRSPEPRRFQAVWVGIGLLAIMPGIASAFLYVVPPHDDATAMTASFIPYGMILDAIALVGFGIALLRARQRLALLIMTGFSLLLLVLQLCWIAPRFIADPRPSTGRPFTVISLNMKLGMADVERIRAEAQQADVVILLEVTPTAYARVRSALASRFPQVVPSAIPTGNQSMILSRYPLSNARELRSTNLQWSATTTLPGLGPVNVIAAHPCNPLCGGRRWESEHRALLQRAEQLNAGPELIAGDFNATDEHGPMRQMADRGFVSAADITGAGWMPTFPTGGRLPPLIEIDHVLVNHRLTVLSVDTFSVPGTDHLGLIARIAKTAR